MLSAKVAPVAIGYFSVEGLMDENGAFYVAIPQLAAINLVPNNLNNAELESYLGIRLDIKKVKTEQSLDTIEVVSIDDFSGILIASASRGNTIAIGMINGACPGARLELPDSNTIKVKDKQGQSVVKIKHKDVEKGIQKNLAKQLKGRMEVYCPVGRIDILTNSQIIEIKEASSWKSAVGQILTYGSYYPEHRKRIHLFGECQICMRVAIRECCKALDIEVTWD